MSESKKSILIIDDESSNLKILTHMLNQDYTVFATKDGKTGIDMAVKNRPDLILLDIVMPDMDGHAVLSDLRANDSTREIPVIFCTGLSETEIKAEQVAADGFIAKPFSADSVKGKVRSLINR